MKTLLACLTCLLALGAATAQPPQTPPTYEEIKAKLLEHDRKLDAIMARLGIPQTPPVQAAPAAVAVQPVVVSSAPASFNGIVPAGMHAHRRTDGSVFVHGHGNFADPAAHAGVAWPWVQVAQAGQYVPPATVGGFVPTVTPAQAFAAPVVQSGTFSQTVTGSFGASSACPNGQCPAQQSFGTPFRTGLRRLLN